MENDRQLIMEMFQHDVHWTDSSSDSDGSSDSNSSSSSEFSDFEEIFDEREADRDMLFPMLQILLHGRRRPKVHDYLNTIHQKSDEQFRKDYRLTRQTAYDLIDDLHASGFIPVHRDGSQKISAELSFLLFLRFVGNEDPHRTISDLFDVSESSVFRVIRRVVDWLVTLVPQHIVWPQGNQARAVSEKFFELQGIRGCIGAVDGSHIRIITPSVENSREYFNRKHYASVNLTAIVGADKKFLMVSCGEPGSMHDIRVFRRTDFHQAVEENQGAVFPGGTFLIGDAAYQGLNPEWMVVPFRDNGHLTANQRNFNTIISSMRVVVEQSFGLLKGRFRRLLHQVSLFDLPFINDMVIACCVLHNICLKNGDDGEDLAEVVVDDVENVVDDVENNMNIGDDYNNCAGLALGRRARLFRQLFPPPAGHENAL